jgi:hypothetical protein
MEGSTSSFPLYPDNDTTKPPMATAQVSTDGVTITFNDNVNNLQKVKGSCYFTIALKGKNTSDNHNAEITSGKQSATVRVDDASGTGVVGFATKDGNYTTDGSGRILWTLRINSSGLRIWIERKAL